MATETALPPDRTARMGGTAIPLVAMDVRRIDHFGFGTHIRNTVRGLMELPPRLRYALLGSRDDLRQWPQLPDHFRGVEMETSEAAPSNLLRLPWRLRQLGANLLHVPHHEWVPLWLPCPYLVTVHDLVEFVLPQAAGRGRGLRRRLVRRSLQRAARIVAVSESTRRDIMRQFRVPFAHIQVVKNAIDEELRRPANGEERAQAAARYALDAPFVLYAGSVQPHKNIGRLIEAFAALKAGLAGTRWETLKLVVIGDEPSRHPGLRRTVIRSRMRQEVRFLGFVPRETLRALYAEAAVFAFPSLHEGFGLPPLEAMAQGTPVVASNSASLPEVVQQAAVLVNPENVFDIHRGLRQCLLDEELRQKLRAAGLAQVRQFSWRDSARRLEDIYCSLAYQTR